MIKIGCCGFPKGRATYFNYFRCIELQNTFYQPPKNFDTLKKLRDQTPAGFGFIIKSWQIITHPANLPTYRRLKEEVGDRNNYGFFRPTKEVFIAYQRVYDIAKILGARIILSRRAIPHLSGVGVEDGAPDVTSGRSGFPSAEARKERYCGCKAAELHFQTPPSFRDNQENIDNMYTFFRKIDRANLIFC